MGTRPYEQRQRAESAEENRRRMLDALYERMREAPAQPISVEEIARRAGVARSTVYLVFGSRTGLFDALMERLLEGEGYRQLVGSVRDPDARTAMRGAIRGGVEMYAAHREVFRVLLAMARLDPEGAGRALGRSEETRTAGIARMSRRLAEGGILRPGMRAGDAAGVLWLVAGFEAYDALAGRGMSTARITRTLVGIAERTLFPD